MIDEKLIRDTKARLINGVFYFLDLCDLPQTEDFKFVEMWGWDYKNKFGVIVAFPSKIVWTNQVGGTSCEHPGQEGIFIPLPEHHNPNSGSSAPDRYCSTWMDDYDEEDINKWLSEYDLQDSFEARKDCKLEYCEAWVPVKIKDKSYFQGLEQFGGCNAIITYCSSD